MGNHGRALSQRLGPIIAALALGVVVVWPALLGGELLVGRDLLPQFYPRMDVIGSALAEGHVPRWNPLAFHGAPLFGLRTGGVMYPGHLLFAALPLGLAMALYVALHFAIAIEGARRLASHDRPGAPAAFVGVVYGLGGFLASQHWALPYLVSGAWLPWALLGAARLPARPARGVALFALAIGMQLLSGEPQGALATAVAGAALTLLVASESGLGSRRALAGAVGAVGLGAALAGPQVLSMLLELGQVDRLSEGHEFDSRWGFAPTALLLDALAPGALGQNAAHLSAYWGEPLWDEELPWCGVGLGALGLAAVASGLGSWRTLGRLEWFGLGLTLAGLVLAASPATRLLHLRFPAKWLVLSALGLALLTGAGAAVWLDRPRGRAAPLVLVGLLLLTGIGAAGGGDLLAKVVAGVELWPAARDATAGAFGRATVGAAVGLLAWRFAMDQRWSRAARGAVLVGALTFDLLSAARAGVRTTTLDLLERPPMADELVRVGEPSPGIPPRYGVMALLRSYVPVVPGLAPEEAGEVFFQRLLTANHGYRFGIRTIFAFEAVEDGHRGRLARDPRFREVALLLRQARIGVDLFLLTREQLEAADAWERANMEVLRPVTGAGDLFLARNLACPAWALCVGEVTAAGSVDEVIAALSEPALDSSRHTVLGPEGAPTGPVLPTETRSTITVRRFESERVEVEVETDAACWLVVRDAYDPDWRATMDGRPAEIARADLFFRAVRVPEGRHVVVFTYHPRWWVPGLLLMAAGAAVLVALSVSRSAGREPSPRQAG